MSTRTTTLALEVVSEVNDGVSGLERVESAAESTAAALGKLEAANDKAGAALEGVTSKAEGLDAAGAGLTGALGALSSGFELIGAEKAAEALNNAGLATDFLSGVGQAAALAVEGQAKATALLTGAQKAANIAMRANPIGLVITAVVALVAILGVAYAKSETFRNIVQAAGAVGKKAFDTVTEAVKAVVSWVADRIPAAFRWLQDKAGAVTRPATAALEAARDGAKDLWDWVGKIPGGFGDMKDKAQEIAAPLLAPFTAVKDAVQWIIDKLATLKMPDWVSKLPGVGRVAASPSYALDDTPAVDSLLGRPAAAPTTQVAITVQGAVDPYSTAVQIRDLLGRYGLAVS